MSSGSQGDPGSIASLVSQLRRHERALAESSHQLAQAREAAADGWVGRVATRHRETLDDVDRRTGAVGHDLAALAAALEEYGDSLSEAKGDLRRIEERAGSVGLVVSDGQVLRRAGVLGEADPDLVQEQDETIEALQRRLSRSTVMVERRRSALVDRAEAVRRSLS